MESPLKSISDISPSRKNTFTRKDRKQSETFGDFAKSGGIFGSDKKTRLIKLDDRSQTAVSINLDNEPESGRMTASQRRTVYAVNHKSATKPPPHANGGIQSILKSVSAKPSETAHFSRNISEMDKA